MQVIEQKQVVTEYLIRLTRADMYALLMYTGQMSHSDIREFLEEVEDGKAGVNYLPEYLEENEPPDLEAIRQSADKMYHELQHLALVNKSQGLLGVFEKKENSDDT